MGTLGGGNHFLEIQRDETGRVFVMLHSGSRNLGKTICDEYHKRALAWSRTTGSRLPHDELAFLPAGSDDFDGYWSAMAFASRPQSRASPGSGPCSRREISMPKRCCQSASASSMSPTLTTA